MRPRSRKAAERARSSHAWGAWGDWWAPHLHICIDMSSTCHNSLGMSILWYLWGLLLNLWGRTPMLLTVTNCSKLFSDVVILKNVELSELNILRYPKPSYAPNICHRRIICMHACHRHGINTYKTNTHMGNGFRFFTMKTKSYKGFYYRNILSSPSSTFFTMTASLASPQIVW